MPDSASRKFIDLIFQTSSKWANWDPPIPIKVSLRALMSTIPSLPGVKRQVPVGRKLRED